jgi:hypothetical protein
MRILLAGILAALLAPQEPQPAVQKPERFAAILAAGPLMPQPTAIEIGVDRWGIEATRARLFERFHSGGQAALLEAVKKEGVVGYVRMPNHERLQAGYVQQETRPDGGRRILLLCVRYPGDWEITRDSGWTEYLYRIVALTLDAKNRGTGMVFHTAKVSFGKDGVDLAAELSGQPTKLLSVEKIR